MRIRKSLLFLLLAFLPTMVSAQRPGGYIKRPGTQQNTGDQKEKQRSKTAAMSAERRQRILDNLINNMVYVEGGTFMMGATEEQGKDAWDNEKPVHQVTVSSFSIGKYEVTQEEWIAVMGKHIEKQFRHGDKLPEVHASWDDCQAFIQKLNKLTNLDFRLPTESEWEFAARGGNKSRGYKYAGGNKPNDVAWSSDNADGGCQKVGQLLPNELGLYDMSGNVAEWCQDWYGRYNSGTSIDPMGPPDGVERTHRGGHYSFTAASCCRISERSSAPPDDRGLQPVGFRLAQGSMKKGWRNTDKMISNKQESQNQGKSKVEVSGIKMVFSSNVPSASLYIDNVLLGKVGTYYMKEGAHILRLEANGYIPLKQCIYVEENDVRYVDMIEELAKTKRDQIINNLINNMVHVKGGTFMMGATGEQGDGVSKDETPIHRVTLSSFSIGKFEVTQEEWVAIMGFNRSKNKNPQGPIAGVSWDDCQLFLQELNKLTGKSFRLPTEAEWEYAARGGQESRGFRYSGSNDINEVAWHNENSGKATHKVGQKKANELGLYDMTGNVKEWCQDWYGSYSSDNQTNPVGPSSGSRRVYRGGSAEDLDFSSNIFYRSSNPPYGWGNFYGLRVAL